MVARSGLRMMPTFPPSPLSFRTAGFPSVRLEDVHVRWDLPDRPLAEAGSRHTRMAGQFVATLRVGGPPCLASSESGKVGQHRHRNIGLGQPAPQGSSLRSGLFCPSPSSLNRPHPSHSQARPDFAAVRLIPSAFAVRERLSDPRVVPSFHCLLSTNMSSSMTPEIQWLQSSSSFTIGDGLRVDLKTLGILNSPTIRFTWGTHFGASRFAFATTCPFACLPRRI